MKKYLFIIALVVAIDIFASEEKQNIVIALPLYGAFAKKPNPTDTQTQILKDFPSFMSVMGSPWNIAKLTMHRTEIAELGKKIEKNQTGSFNILRHLAQQAKDKGYGTMSPAMQSKLACSITSQPIIPGIQILLAALQAQRISILGYANQDEKEYECFREYCTKNNIDLRATCNKGIVVYRHHETVSQFSDSQPFLQKDKVTVSYKPFPNPLFLHALQHHASDAHVLIAVPPHLTTPPQKSLSAQLKTVPFKDVEQFTKLLQSHRILQ